MALTSQTNDEEKISLEKNNDKLFHQIISGKNIKLNPSTKIIKAQDSTIYFNAIELLKKSEKVLEDSRTEGVKLKSLAKIKGYEEGTEKANNILATKNVEATSAVANYLSTVEDKLTDVVVSVIRKVINDFDDVEYVTHNINSALKNFRRDQKITLHVHDSLLQDVSSRININDHSTNTIKLIPDPTLNKKDCIVITDLGIINATLKQQLKIIENCLLKLK